MFRRFFRAPTGSKSPKPIRTARLGVESLEPRETPAITFVFDTQTFGTPGLLSANTLNALNTAARLYEMRLDANLPAVPAGTMTYIDPANATQHVGTPAI